MWTPPSDEVVQDTAWKPPADEALQGGSSLTEAAKMAVSMLPSVQLARGVVDAVRDPRGTYQKVGNWLPAAGAVAGSLVAPGLGTAIGGGVGEMARQGLGVAFNDPKVMNNITPGQISPWAGAQAATQTGLAGVSEVNGLARAVPGSNPYAERLINWAGNKLAPIAEDAKTGVAAVGQMLTGKPAAKFKMLMNDPGAILPTWMGGAKSVSEAGQGFEDALKQTGIKKTTFNPFEGDDAAAAMGKETFNKWQAIKNGTATPADLPVVDLEVAKQSERPVALFAGNQDYGNGPKAIYTVYQKGQKLGSRPTLPGDELPAGVEIIGKEPRAAADIPVDGQLPTISAQEAYSAKRATDYLFPKVVSERNAEKIAQMTEFKHAMDDILSNQAGPLKDASKEFARARLGKDFTQIFPRTKTGDISTVKSFLPLFVDAKRMAAVPLTSPLVVGSAVAAGSAAGKAAAFAIAQPTIRQSLISRYIAGKSGGQN